MLLIEYMRREGLGDAEFAAAFNAGLPADRRRGARAVRKWKYGERRPDPDGIIRIEAITGGAVVLRDWASDALDRSKTSPHVEKRNRA
jgi:hypothetical protein